MGSFNEEYLKLRKKRLKEKNGGVERSSVPYQRFTEYTAEGKTADTYKGEVDTANRVAAAATRRQETIDYLYGADNPRDLEDWRKDQKDIGLRDWFNEMSDNELEERRARAEEFNRTRQDNEEDNEKKETLAPVSENKERTWFQSSKLWEDGYQFGDIAKTILGTVTDVAENVGAGVIGMGEAALDGMLTIAPYFAQGQYYANGGGYNLQADQMFEQSMKIVKKENAKIVEKDLYDEEEIAKQITTNPVKEVTGIDAEVDSVLGEKTDALAQSGGQLLGTAALQAAGIPWYVTTGATALGSESENALKQGATMEEAALSGMVSAGAEILTEQISGGIKFGKMGTLDDVVTKELSTAISNKFVRALAKSGVDMAGEGLEEVASGSISKFGQWLTYQDEATLEELYLSEEAMDEAIESFIGGAVLGGVSSGGKVVNSAIKGFDPVTELTKSEQNVVDKVYKDTIAEMEADGKKLTAKEKHNIRKGIFTQLERGYISTDTIEEVLGGEAYKHYQNEVKRQQELADELNELRNMKTSDMTDIQQERMNELKASGTNQEMLNTLKFSVDEQIRNALESDAAKLKDRGSYLAESYNEQTRKTQAFEADLSQYDDARKTIIQNAIDSGILNNSNRTHDFVDMVANISADKGVLFNFADNAKIKESGFGIEGKTVNGYVTKDGVTLNVESAKSLNSVVGHEIAHVLEGTELYKELSTAITEYAKAKGDYQGRYDALSKLYEGVKDADINAELTADLVGDYLFTDEKFVNNLSVQHRNVFQKLWDEIKYLYNVATAGSKEARELEKVKKVFEKAYKAGGKAQTGTKYSMSDSTGKALTKEQSDYFKDSKMRDDNGNLKVMYHGSQDAGFHVFDPTMSDDGTSLFFVDSNDVAASYSGTTETYEAQTIKTAEDMNAFIESIGAEGYEVAENNGKFTLYYEGERVADSNTAKGIYKEFCWYEGVGEGDANYKVYLNLTNPLEIDAKGRPWNKIDAEFSQEIYDKYNSLTPEEKEALTDLAEWEDFRLFNSEVQEARGDAVASAYAKMGEDCNIYDLFSVAADNFSEEAMRENARGYLKTRDFAQRAKEGGYDGVIIKDVHDNGGYSNGSEGASTVAIAFNSEQVKSVANDKPTSDPDIRFSLSESVEETKDLIAIHNLQASELPKALALGGMPMPSVAIIKAQQSHESYGDVSLIFPKDAIDPAKSKSNKIYGGDAWTPTYPSIEYKASAKAQKAIEAKINGLVPYDVQKALGNLAIDYDNISSDLNRHNGDMYRAYSHNRAMQYAFLVDNGFSTSLPMTEKALDGSGRFDNSLIVDVVKKLGASEVERFANGSISGNDALISELMDLANENAKAKFAGNGELLEVLRKRPIYTDKNFGFAQADSIIRAAYHYVQNGVEQTVDYKKAADVIEQAVDKDAYKKWLDNLFSDIVEKEGIRNNVDYSTPSGNRRSWEALHWENTLENVLKVMKAQNQTGQGFFGGASIFGVATKDYSSIDEVKADSDRLHTMPEEEYEALKSDFSNRLVEIADSIKDPNERNRFIALDNAVEEIVDAVRSSKTKSGILRNMQKWNKRVTAETVDDIVSLVTDIANMPTGYFEAKPQRAVGFDEVGVFVIPYNADPKLKQELLNRGYAIAEYNPDVEGDRQKVVNSFEEYKFSLSAEGSTPKRYGSYNVYGKDISLPMRADISKVENTHEGIAPMVDKAVDKAVDESVYPEGFAPMEHSSKYESAVEGVKFTMDRLSEEASRLYGEGKVDEAQAIIERMQELTESTKGVRDKYNTLRAEERTNTEGYLNSLTDADAPPEIEAPYSMPRGNITLNDKTVNRVTKEISDGLGLDAEDTAKMAELVQKYAQNENMTEGELFEEIKKNFGYSEVISNNTDILQQAKKHIRGTRLYASDRVKSDFPEWNYFRKKHFGKFILTNDKTSLGIDTFYQELNELYPALFPADIEHPAEQLQQIATVTDSAPTIDYRYEAFDNETVQEICDTITDGVRQYSQSETLKQLENDRISFYSSLGMDESISPEKALELDDEYQVLTQKYEEAHRQYMKVANREGIPSEKNFAKWQDDYRRASARENYWFKKLTEYERAFLEKTEDIAPLPTYDTASKAQIPGQQTVFEDAQIEEAPTKEAPKEEPPKIAKVLTEEPQSNKKKPNIWSLIKNNVLDKGMIFEDISLKTGNRELQAKWNSIRYAKSKAQQLIGKGNEHVKPLQTLKDTVDNSGKVQEFSDYLYHLHNVDRMSLEGKAELTRGALQSKFGHLRLDQIQAIALTEITDKTTERTANTIREAQQYLSALDAKNKPVFGDEVTADISRQTAAELEKANPEFKEWAKEVYEYTNYLREMLVEEGVISRETADLWAEMYPHYIPIRRDGKDGPAINVALDTNKTGINAPIKRATGGNSDILPLFDTMALRTEQTYRAIAKNRFGVELKNTLGTTIDRGNMSLDDAIANLDNDEGLLKKGENGANPTFTVFEDGKRVEFEITEEMYDAIKPTGKGLSYTNKVANTAGNIFRGLLTEYNPVFMATNAVKDVQDVLINSQHAAKTYANIPMAVKEIATRGHWYQEYVKNGGDQNTYFDSNTKTFKSTDKGVIKIVGMPLRAISAVNNTIESLPRLAEYIASRKSGASVDVSMLDAARVTTNFAAGGDLTKALNRNGFTFLNASTQGAIQQVRNIREAKANGFKGWLQLAAKTAIAGVPALILNGALWDDDEDYEELSDYVKDNYYIIAKYGDGKFVRIPKGRTVAVIQSAFEQMKNLVTGDDEVDMQRFFELAISNLAPNNPLENNLIAPIMQVANNKTWYGEDLVPSRLQDLPDAEQYDESTDSISKWLGEKLDYSPYKINYLLNQYSGGVGDVVLPMLTPESDGSGILAPFTDKFTTDSVMKNQNVTDFYDTLDELTKNANSSKATDEDILANKYMNTIRSEISDLYAQKREIQNSDLSDAEKDELVREIQEQINAKARESLDTYGDVRIDGNYATVGDIHYRWYEPSEDSDAEAGWEKITDKQLARQEKVTRGLGITPSEYWSNKEEYDFAYDSPGKYAVSKAVGGYASYKSYSSQMYDIKGVDKDGDGKSDPGTRKDNIATWINTLDIDYGEKIILFKSQYKADDTYNYDIIEYLNNREDISRDEMITILTELGFTVDDEGYIWWD